MNILENSNSICSEGFTEINKPTLDRKNNKISHPKENVVHVVVIAVVLRLIEMNVILNYIFNKENMQHKIIYPSHSLKEMKKNMK
jgi:hypothetical protein